MDAQTKAKVEIKRRPKIIVWYGRIIMSLGVILIVLGILISILVLIAGDFINSILIVHDIWGAGVGIFVYGVAVTKGKRWHLFGLLNIVFFGGFLIGLFSMVGRETSIGYYIWALGGLISLSIFLILVIYWNDLLDD